MIRWFAIIVFVMCFVSISSVLAGMWRDDFEDGNFDGWEVFEPIPAEKWGVENGECSGEWLNAIPDYLSGLFLKAGNATLWKDCTVECRMKFVGELPSGSAAGMSFRETGMFSGRYVFTISASENAAQGSMVFQNKLTFPSKVALPFTVSRDTWYKLKVIVEGNRFEFYVDEKPAGGFSDNSIPSGGVGLVVRDTRVHFDDVIISGDNIEDGGNWDPSKHTVALEPKSNLAATWGEMKGKQ